MPNPAGRSWSRLPGSETVLTVYLCLLLAIPSPMVVGPLGSAGAPSSLMAVAGFGWWVWNQVHRSSDTTAGFQPVRAAALGWLLIMLSVYAHAMARPMSGDEISPADSGLLKLVGLVGVVLVANDGLTSLAGLRAVVRRFVIGVGLLALLGLLQYGTQQLYVDRLSIPGLTSGTSGWELASRSGLSRPSGTSTHPIEYGVVLTTALPLAIVYAMKSPTRRWFYRLLLAAISMAIFLAISRSALLCAAVGLLLLSMSWTARARVRALGLVAVLVVVVYVTVPGVMGTLLKLFTGASDDPSISSRTGSYDLAFTFVERSPWLGRGFGTFLPKYWILDNGWLGLLIEGGVVGAVGLVVLVLVAMTAARRAYRTAPADLDAALGQALLASVGAAACALAFFDSFGFPQSAGCFFLVMGLAGAARRLALAEPRRGDLAADPVAEKVG